MLMKMPETCVTAITWTHLSYYWKNLMVTFFYTHIYLRFELMIVKFPTEDRRCDCFFSCVSSAVKGPDKPIAVVYVPSHLYHMVFELFKVLYITEMLMYKIICSEFSIWQHYCMHDFLLHDIVNIVALLDVQQCAEL